LTAAAGRVVHPAVVLRAAIVLLMLARVAGAAVLAESMSVSGDSISRAYDANTGSCNYGDNVSRNWATGDDHGGSFCSSGGTTFSHAERLECAKGGDVTIFNDAASGADMLSDFYNQAQSIKLNLSSSPAPRYVAVFQGHNDICTNTTSRTGNGCSGDDDPNNYCRTTNVAFEREFRRGMDQLIQIPSARIGVSALARVSELCNFGSKSGCGLGAFGDCELVWSLVDICASLTVDCSDQRRIDAYNTAVGYNEILERVTVEYAAIPVGGLSLTGAVKAPTCTSATARAPSTTSSARATFRAATASIPPTRARRRSPSSAGTGSSAARRRSAVSRRATCSPTPGATSSTRPRSTRRASGQAACRAATASSTRASSATTAARRAATAARRPARSRRRAAPAQATATSARTTSATAPAPARIRTTRLPATMVSSAR
jgi:hypothetical protein